MEGCDKTNDRQTARNACQAACSLAITFRIHQPPAGLPHGNLGRQWRAGNSATLAVPVVPCSVPVFKTSSVCWRQSAARGRTASDVKHEHRAVL